ncbi:hypothetical protein SADUNF_Sadunf16G0046000 [Salix dunnii]|uniref:Uncharacterized protein n=1 Tax=Salix dunnii TaxID=1413687 RepID=A0A835JCE1_9ROSI|nr:hypothetical protein SADUNF_Sadunf16G0046000 [Salix dunnii]
MELKKISCAVLVVAASMSAALAADEVSAPAPSPTSGASGTLPAVGSLIGASLNNPLIHWQKEQNNSPDPCGCNKVHILKENILLKG